jgi:hypothetical protein
MLETAAEWVNQDLARWCKGGEAIQLTERIAEPSVAESAITNTECEANAGAAEMVGSIAAARRKVGAWPRVGADPDYGKPTRAPLPTQPGGIKTISCEELERLSSGIGLALVGSGARPVDKVLRESRTRLPNNDVVQQHYEDDEREASSDVPVGYHEIDSELET